MLLNSIISPQELENRLYEVLFDSVLLDMNFVIVGVNESVCQLTGYKEKELVGESISVLTGDIVDFKRFLFKKLELGSIIKTNYNIRCKDEGIVETYVSGFYLGLISDINGKIIIQIQAKLPD